MTIATATSSDSMPERKHITRELQAWKKKQDEEDRKVAEQKKQQANTSR